MKTNKLGMLANNKGFTLIELMICICILCILAAVAIPNFIEYKNKSYCSATVNDVNAIAGALANYFANPSNISASTQYNPGSAGTRPYLLVGNESNVYRSDTLLLSASTTMSSAAQGVPTDAAINGAAAGAFRVGANYKLFACEGASNCPAKVLRSDTHWVADIVPGIHCYFNTL